MVRGITTRGFEVTNTSANSPAGVKQTTHLDAPICHNISCERLQERSVFVRLPDEEEPKEDGIAILARLLRLL